MNEFHYQGQDYKAQDITEDTGCKDCEFNPGDRCFEAPDCTPNLRKDGRNIIWVKAE